MHYHPGWLVDHREMLVFEQDVELNELRFRPLLFRGLDAHFDVFGTAKFECGLRAFLINENLTGLDSAPNGRTAKLHETSCKEGIQPLIGIAWLDVERVRVDVGHRVIPGR